MKKLKYAGLALLIMLFTSGSAFAAITINTWVEVGNGFESCLLTPSGVAPAGADSMTLTGSKNVSFTYTSTDLHYIIGTNHKSGNKTYGASSDSQKIWAATDAVKGTPTGMPVPAANAVDWSSQALFSAQ